MSNHLSINHWNFVDDLYKQNMTKKELKETLLECDFVFKNGEIYNIKSKHLGVNVYSVWLEKKKY